MDASPEILGLIAGSRSLPLVAAREARRAGVRRIVAVAFEKETDPALASLVDEIVWVRVGQLSKLISAFTSRGVRHCIMVGQVAPGNLFDLRPDLRALKLLLTIKEKNAHSLFTAIADELARDHVKLIPATPWLQPFMPGIGFRLGPVLSETQEADVAYAFRMAKEISRLEIGQSVVVKDGAVLAVEAFEGTDRCLARGGELAGPKGGAVAVKVAKSNHDMRFDIPCLGAKTLEVCAAGKIAVLGFEAGCTLLLDQDEVAPFAEARKITVLAVDGAPPKPSQ